MDQFGTDGQQIAHYRIISKLGEGGMGAVYRATDTKLNRDVAIKVLPDAFAQDADRMARFEREAQMLASLNHPNIAAIYGVEERALVMELVEGQTLSGPVPVEQALPIIHQLIDALEYAHEKGIVHRDLKPANIKITPEGRVKVLDFGLAKAMSGDPASGDSLNSPTLTMRATMAGVILGTAAYMAPEQARGHSVDKRADIWAFGVVVYELVTGRQLFEGPSVSDTLAAVLKETPDWEPVPKELQRLVRACLVRDVRQRMRDIGDARLLLQEPAAATPVPVARPSAGRLWKWVAAALGVALAALAAMHFRENQPESTAVRFQIPAPEKSDYATGGMALSPDGKRLAFITTAGSGGAMLWVRALDSLESRPLPGTEGAGFLPFWSPDSRFIAFGVQGKLKKVDSNGGPPQTLCEIPGAVLGGSWNREGTILFGYNAGGLYRVPQAGGNPTKLTTSDESKGELGHLRPWFLPDGRHFLYVSRTSATAGGAIYVAALDSPERKRLVESRQAGEYVPPAPGAQHGHLLFLREGTLMAEPMDAKRYDLIGEAFPVAEQVGSVLAMGYFAASSNGVLAYRAGAAISGNFSQLTWIERTGKVQEVLLGGAAYTGSVQLSPDGRLAAVEQMDNTNNRDVWRVDLARRVPTRFTFDIANERAPVWSPDGSQLLFSSDRESIGSPQLYRKASNGTGTEEVLLKSGVSMFPSSWSNDGRNVLYESNNPKAGFDLWILPLGADGAPEKPVPYLQSPSSERQGQFSPDGRWVAYISDENSPTQFQIYVQSFPVGAGKFQISTGPGGTQPRWRRDGKELFYVASDGKLMSVEVKTAPRFEAGTPKALFDLRSMPIPLPGGVFRYDVAPDGKRFLVITPPSDTNHGTAAAPITVVLNWNSAVRR
jgi:Tol biopolymer transport system component/predicted Ser/Thr protein kinase